MTFADLKQKKTFYNFILDCLTHETTQESIALKALAPQPPARGLLISVLCNDLCHWRARAAHRLAVETYSGVPRIVVPFFELHDGQISHSNGSCDEVLHIRSNPTNKPGSVSEHPKKWPVSPAKDRMKKNSFSTQCFLNICCVFMVQ